jgi:cation diffusion facilitator CzcD-associated flavoprotein CzcO
MEPVVIIGAGPAGLATAALLKQSGVRFALLDRTGRVGGSFRVMQPNMKLLSPRRYANLPLLAYPGKETYPLMVDYGRYLEKYAANFGLSAEQRDVTGVTRKASGFEIHCSSASAIDCRLVVVATGLFSYPVWPEIEGLQRNALVAKSHTDCSSRGDEALTSRMPQPHRMMEREMSKPAPGSTVLHACDWQGAEGFAGRRILIIGAGVSGVGIAEECVKAGLQVMVSRRAGRHSIVHPRLLGLDILHWWRPVERLPRAFFSRLCREGVHPPAYDDGYRAFVASGRIVEVPEVKRVQDGKVECADGGRREVDVIVTATGYSYGAPFLPPEVRRMPGGHPMTRDCESPDWRGLFFVGAPCGRRIDSEFLRGIARDAAFVAQLIKRRLTG